MSPKQLKPKKSTNGMSSKSGKSSRQRKSSVSVYSDNGSEYYAAGGDEARPDYYSGLEGSSDEDGSASELDSDDLELGDDDIPVTGFAVASNKRNADFHELFPTVPEGDYLIEGGWFVLCAKSLLSDLSTRLWLRVAEGNFNSRTTLYFREPYLFSCQYIWMDHRRKLTLLWPRFGLLSNFLLLSSCLSSWICFLCLHSKA